jgi:antitoxin component of MazEF toxin-antitoxin module
MVQKLVKYGNSLAAVIPADVSKRHGLQAGSLVQIMEQDGRIVLCPLEVVPKLSQQQEGFVRELYQRRAGVFKKLAE